MTSATLSGIAAWRGPTASGSATAICGATADAATGEEFHPCVTAALTVSAASARDTSAAETEAPKPTRAEVAGTDREGGEGARKGAERGAAGEAVRA